MKRFSNIFPNMTGKMMLMAGMLLVSVVVMAQEQETGVRIHGNVYGGGNLADVKENTEVNMNGGAVYGNVFGGGKGTGENSFTCDKAMVGTEVSDNACEDPDDDANKDKGTKVIISNGTVGTLEGEAGAQTLKAGTGNVYGGGEVGRVEWNTQVLIGVGTGGGTFEPVIYGSVFGAGSGLETHGYSALVRGNSTVTIQGDAKIGYNVYGGGEKSTVGRYWVKDIPAYVCTGETAPIAPTDLPSGMPYQQRNGGICRVTIQGNAEIGYNGATDDKGHVFGAGKGVEPHFVASGEGASQKMTNSNVLVGFTDEIEGGEIVKTAEQLYLEFLQSLALVTNSYVTIDGSAQVKGSVFGGSENGFVQTNTNVTIQGSCVIGTTTYGNVFGGGRGLLSFAEAGKVKGNTTVTIDAGTIKGNVYGGGSMGDVGIITKPADYNYTWKKTDGTTANTAENNGVTYAENETNINTGVCTVIISGGTIGIDGISDPDEKSKHGNVFGAGRGSSETWWCEKAMVFATNVSIKKSGTSETVVYGNVYGGGEIGRVEDDAKVTIGTENASEGSAAPDIKGSVFGAGAGKETHGYSALVRGNADVTVQGKAQVGGSVYGGGETASVGKFRVDKGLPKEPLSGGYCTVTIQDNAKIGTSGTGHNVFGACKGVTPAYDVANYKNYKSMQTVANIPKDANNNPKEEHVYWDYYPGDDRFIWVYYKTEAEYLSFLETLALTSHPHVTIAESSSVYGSVYGGGERGITLGNVDVDITGGTVEQDVYGGGALADTNRGNLFAERYDIATVTVGETLVTGMYRRTGAGTDGDPYVYTIISEEDTKAADGETYCTKAAQSSINTTTVNLAGGTIKGDAYGGGLGQKDGFNGKTGDVPAVVWGDIDVTLGKRDEATATSFWITYDTDDNGNSVVNSGRVFGCNNLLGSPRGNVTVTVWKTADGKDANGATITKTDPEKKNSTTDSDHSYRLAAIYGGGNLADYTDNTAIGLKAHVIIHGCSDTSILTVYGGGNAAAVPETDVDVYSVYEIGALFGGGNGSDKYTTDGGTTWKTNLGANVNGNANTMIYGGTVHEAYGGSNEKGTITGNVTIDVGSNVAGETCTLDVGKLVGAGKNADVNGDLKIVMGCKPEETIPLVFGGADNANVNGDVELTVTSGNFGKVFGGNNDGGFIKGHIILNIEETTCIPIKIDHLYLCGNDAAYSQYGYYVKTTETEAGTGNGDTNEHAILTDNNKIQLIPRESADDDHLPVDTYSYSTNETTGEVTVTWTVLPITGNDKFEGYDAPVLNVISCTKINEVFGGGFGTGATVYGNPTVNINMIPGDHADEIDRNGDGEADGDNTLLGEIGNVYGGGDAADVIGNPTVNIGTVETVDVYVFDNDNVSGEYVLQYDGETPRTTTETVTGAYITGNVYGGGKGEAKTTAGEAGEAFLCAKAMVSGDIGTHVNIGNGYVGGNVYGGGQVGRVEHNTVVKIGLDDDDIPTGKTSAPVIKGNVFGAGAGVKTHGYSALVRGNSTVTIQANSKVEGSVYGGGEMASVGKYRVVNGLPVALDPDNIHPNSGYCYVNIRGNAEIGPDDMEMTKSGGPDDSGFVYGAGKGVLPFEGYADNAQPFHMNGRKVGNGWEDEEKTYPAYDATKDLDADYEKFIKSLALATRTEVTISGNPFIKGGIFGGAENGYVQENTHVTISGGQIGNGYVQMDDDGEYLANPLSVNRRYTDAEWAAGHLILGADDRDALKTLVGVGESATYYTSSLPECASWQYGQAANVADRYAPYDPNANASGYYDNGNTKSAEGGRPTGDDGHTFYGNVFGGGSGYYPYKPGRWFEDAGSVYGNTTVEITGGHILTSVYGGNEMTDVGKYQLDDDGKPTTTLLSGGKCTITMSGGTLGVPRTLKQIAAHPVTCYLFGAGKGDPRVLFNKSTNVGDVEVNITGGTIYGSVFGGGEDGHVMRDVTMTIGEDGVGNADPTGPTIGTWGTSYVDGNVFGGGRGFSGDAYTAGNVGGCVDMKIKGGTMLGSIYGGGRLGSVGYGLYASDEAGYGEMRNDNVFDNGTTTSNFKRGHIDITISGGTIGNDREYKYYTFNVENISGKTDAQIDEARDNALQEWKNTNYISKTEFALDSVDTNNTRTYTARLSHTKGGNVFAGGMGNFYKQDGVTPMSVVNWWQVGCVKSTKVTITGGTIKSNVYGGGELGQVVGHHTIKNAQNEDVNLSTEITISGNTIIGTEVKDADGYTKYTFGSVFGGGYGSLMEEITINGVKSIPKYIAGLVKEDTKVDMQGGTVKASIYGGGEMASVGEKTTSGETTTVVGSSYVTVSNGTVGIQPITVSGNKRYFGGAKMGNVYGGGSGSGNTVQSGKIFKSSNVNISGGRIYHNVYGGGAYGTVGDFQYKMDNDPVTQTQKVFGILGHTAGTGVATVTVTGGTIGYDGKENGMVFGSSRGDINQPNERDDHTAWVYDTHVTIGTSNSNSGPHIKGTVYGSGENGHVFNDTEVTVNSGKIGIDSNSDPGYSVTSGGTTYEGAAYPYRGNVYGGGCGTDKYYENHSLETHDGNGQLYNSLAGIVYGNSTINITGGTVVRNVYGAGAMGSVGKVVTTTTEGETPTTTTSITSGGQTTINISGGTIGVDATVGDGNVYGAARGDSLSTQTDCALVLNTSVNISSTADIKGSVYGGGETGNVLENTEVNVCAVKQTSGETVTYAVSTASRTPTIGGNVYGGGKGSANLFDCSKAMVGIVDKGVTITGESPNETYTLQPGGTTVRIYNGTVGTLVNGTLKNKTGNVYGGGEIARVERNSVVEIGAGSGTTAPTIRGSVFAAGAGLDTHGYSALVRGTSTVTVQGNATVKKNVYGGGEKASVGRYKVKIANGNPSDAPADLPNGMPYGLKAGGTSYVTVQGSAIIGTANDATTGHVYGAGKGVEPRNYDYQTEAEFIAAGNSAEDYDEDVHKPKRMIGNNTWEHFGSRSAYLQFIETLAISASTDVTIGGSATVMGSVFGGSESGFVYQNTDVKIQGGTVNGDAFGGGQGLESFAEAGRVRWNTNLAVSGGAVEGNVYGGGKLGDVGTIYKPSGSYDYVWRNTDANGNNLAVSDEDHNYENTLGNNAITTNNKNTGICTVSVSGGTIGLTSTNEPAKHGNVFGAGRGSSTTWWCEKAIVYATDVSVTAGTVYGTVYGGGEVGRVEDDAKVTIGTPGETGANKPNITGSVFGGGAGLATHGYSALVRGDAAVTVQGAAKVVGNVYGGGEVASVGRFKVVGGLPSKPKGGGTCTVVIKDNAVIGDVYGSCKGVTPAYVASGENRSKSMQLEANAPAGAAAGTTWDYYETYPADYTGTKFIWRYYTEEEYLAFLPTLGLASNTHVTIGGGSIVNGSVFGGGQRGLTLGGVDVNITGGTVSQDVYGGGALANSNSSHWLEGHRTEYVELDELYKGVPITGYYTKSGDTYTLINEGTASGVPTDKYYAIFKTNVNLTGGTVEGNVYGGGLGQLAKDAVAAVLYTAEDAEVINGTKQVGEVKTPAAAAQSAIAAKVYGDVSVKLNEDTNNDDCKVKGTIFGCNNLNGSPQSAVTVHIYKTVGYDENHTKDPNKGNSKFDLNAVYGGGNLAAYYPDDATSRASAVANVIIDGCDLTSIKTVYGGGNAASVPATEVVVNGTHEIGQAFGGGNGADNYQLDGVWYQNQGANVGLEDYTHWETSGTTPGTVVSPYYLAINNTTAEQGGDASTKENRIANYSYGVSESLGKSHISIFGGTVHEVYGGSNSRGNVRDESRTTLDDHEECSFTVTDAYGGGNNAPQDGDAVLEIGCINGLGKAYGGASNADVNGNVVLNITNGTYGRVFGGNDQGGLIRGSITVNIEETGCRPIIIGELYGGGNQASYSIYGYNDDGSVKETGNDPVENPQLNVKSFTSIGTIYGGGFGAGAVMVGDPQVNINVTKGRYAATYNGNDNIIEEGYTAFDIPVPTHTKGAIGAINNVFGGGNEAEVIGTPHVNIGTLTGEIITLASKKIEDSEGRSPSEEGWIPSYQLATVEGVDIRGNVFGAGNNANVTGDTEVVIGKNNKVKTYSFTSYDAATGGTAWSSGLAQTTGVAKNNLSEVVILTNGKYGEFVGNKYYVAPDATTDGTARTELKDANGASLSPQLYVAIKPFENKKTYNFTSWSASSGGTQYSTGTAAPTGNFKTFSSTEYMQIVVLTNPGETTWVGKTFYVPVNASTNGSTRTQLYKADGTEAGVWVTITE